MSELEPLDLDRIERLYEAATDEPWDVSDFMVMHFHGADGLEHAVSYTHLTLPTTPYV